MLADVIPAVLQSWGVNQSLSVLVGAANVDLHKEILVSCLLFFRLFSLGMMLSGVQGEIKPLDPLWSS